MHAKNGVMEYWNNQVMRREQSSNAPILHHSDFRLWIP